ncbi:MAG: hypothetical protein AMXMBFR25_30170 [Lysobacterales bacterium]
MSALPRSPSSGYRVRALGLGDGSDWLIGNGRHRLGRSEQADLRLAHASVSRLHAEVEVIEGGGVVLTDLGYRNFKHPLRAVCAVARGGASVGLAWLGAPSQSVWAG